MSAPTVQEMFTRLVAEPSVSCSNKALDQGNSGVCTALGTWLEDLGAPITLYAHIYAQKGMMMLAIHLRGRSGHSSNPDLGVNALDAMHAVMTALLAFRAELAQRYRHHGQAGVSATISDIFSPLDPFETPPDSRFVRLCERLTSQQAGTVAFGTEGPYLQALGMETVILGPGSIDQAHQPDEYLRLDRLQPTIDVLRGLIAACCIDHTDLAA